jgi:hypothetical protein
MNKLLMLALGVAMGASAVAAQSLDDLNIQIHGYATQGFLYTNNNNIFTTNSSDGSPAWTEAVVNVGAQPMRKLRVGVQGRYFLLGNIGNTITLDWAQADYKANNKFGVRFGKVKTPVGLFNEVQDIDPSYMWSLLPQTVYPIESRNSLLAHLGGVVYGTLKLGPSGGDLEYRGWGGQLSLGPNDGYFINQNESGVTLPNGMTSPIVGGALRWRTPVSGLIVGASDNRVTRLSGASLDVALGALLGIPEGVPGTESLKSFNQYDYFIRYEGGKLMLATEYNRLPVHITLAMPAIGVSVPLPADDRAWYGMVTYKATEKLSVGSYYTQYFDHQGSLGSGRYLKDWALSGRYDFNPYIYAKAEQHLMDGTADNLSLFDTDLNQHGLQPKTKLTILKIGVSF